MQDTEYLGTKAKAWELLLAAASRDWVFRSDALDQLWQLAVDNEDSELEVLALIAARALSTDPDEVVRTDALDVIANLGNIGDYRRIMAATFDRHWSVRAKAASAAAHIIGARAVPRILELVQDNNEFVRKYAGVALFNAAGCKYLDLVLQLIGKEKSRVALAGLSHYAAMCGNEAAIDELERLANDSNPDVAISAAESLAELPHVPN